MDMKKNETLTKIKDWFIINGIRFKNFVIEHKYVSSVIGLFLISSIVGLIVFAEDDNYKNKISTKINESEIELKTINNEAINLNNPSIKSFDTLVIEVPYTMSLEDNVSEGGEIRRDVIGTATISDGVDAEWKQMSEDANYNIENSGKKLTATIFYKEVGGVNKQKFYLKINNVKAGTIRFKIELKESTAEDENKVASFEKEINITNDKEVPLKAKVQSGAAYKVNGFVGRYAPFGIMVGIDKSEISNGLKGIYFNPDIDLTLSASQFVNNVNSQIEIENESEDYYGLYDRSKGWFDAPNSKLSDVGNSVFDSGSVELAKSSSNDAVISQKKSNNISLNGKRYITITKGQKYEEQGIKLSSNYIKCTNFGESDCKIEIAPNLEDENNDGIKNFDDMTAKLGEYKISYTYGTDDNKTTAYRTVEVIDKTYVNDEENSNITYFLKDNDKIILNDDSEYNLSDVMTRNGENKNIVDANIQYTYHKNTKEDINYITNEEFLNVEGVDKYIVTYTINNRYIIDQTVIIKKNTSSSSPKLELNEDSFNNQKVKIGDSEKKCDDTSNCAVNYLNSDGQSTDKNSAKTVTFIVDTDDFKVQISSEVIIPNTYTLSITGIKTDDIYYEKDGFIALGSYFVNAKSVREENVNVDFDVTLNVSIKDGSTVSATTKNLVTSPGTKELELNFINDDEKIISSDDSLAYGEKIILKSKFTYTQDGDNPIEELKVKIPVNVLNNKSGIEKLPFDITGYENNVEGSEYYFSYFNGSEKSNEKSVSVKYYACKESDSHCEVENKALSYEDYIAIQDKQKLAYVEYTINEVAPGSEIDFRIRLITNIGNSGKTLQIGKEEDCYTIKDGTSGKIKVRPLINITAFKARAKVYVDDVEGDKLIDGSTKSTSTWAIYPSVSLPAQEQETNSAGISDPVDVTLNVTLPDKIKYISNEEYINPTSISSNKQVLTYKISGKKVNEWFEPIYFDTSYDIDIENDSDLEVEVIISATTKTSNISDTSDEKYRTVIRKITYQNPSNVAFGLYSSKSVISKNDTFDISAKYHNIKLENANIYTVILLPFNDIENEKNSFSGKYEIIRNNLEGAYCTEAQGSLLKSHSATAAEDENIPWKECKGFDNLDKVSAIRFEDKEVQLNSSHERKIEIKTNNNNTDDTYIIRSYLYSKDNNDIKKLDEKDIEVRVVSKKVTGTVWEDFNANGIMDDDEKRIPDVTLSLYNKGDIDNIADNEGNIKPVIDGVLSDKNGRYTLSDLAPGEYYVMANYNSVKYGLTEHNIGNNKSVNSSFEKLEAVVIPEESPEEVEDSNDADYENLDDGSSAESDETDTSGIDSTSENTPAEDDETGLVVAAIKVDNDTKTIKNINLGLTLRKVYKVKLSKYISKVVTTNGLGISTTKDYGNVTFAKLDVKDLSNLSVKVVYTLELENTGYYPGYIYTVKDYIPDGMAFNESYEENKGWVLNDEGYLENSTLFEDLVSAGEKKYLTIAFDITRKEAGSFINTAVVEDEDLHILAVSEESEGDGNE